MTKKSKPRVLRISGYASLCLLVGVFGLVSLLTGQAHAKQLKTLIIAQAGDIAHIDSLQSGGEKNAIIQMHDWGWTRYPIVRNPNGTYGIKFGTVVPNLVETWETEEQPDGTAIHRFHIRPGMIHHSGNPVIAEDFKYTMLRRAGLGRDFTNRNMGGQYHISKPDPASGITLEKSIKIIDDLTFDVRCRKNLPLFFDVWCMRVLFDSKLVKPHATKDDPWAVKFCAKNDAGQGPFTLERWETGSEMVLKRFEKYWGPRPKLDRIIFKTVPDLSTRVLLLKNGDVDVALHIPLRELNMLKKDPNITVVSAPSTAMTAIMMNFKYPPFDNKDLRLALSYAFPYDIIINTIYQGAAQPLYGPIPTGLSGAFKERRYKTDLALAKAHLKKAGYEKGLTLTLKWETGQDQQKQIGTLFAENLKQIGVTLKMQQLPRGQFQTGMRKQSIDFFIDKELAWVRTTANTLNLFFTSTSSTNRTGYGTDQTNKMILNALTGLDQDKGIELCEQAQEAVMEDVPWIFICQPDFQVAMRSNVTGYVAQNTELNHFFLLDKK